MQTSNYNYLFTKEAIFIQRGDIYKGDFVLALPIYVFDKNGDRELNGLTFSSEKSLNNLNPADIFKPNCPNYSNTLIQINPQNDLQDIVRNSTAKINKINSFQNEEIFDISNLKIKKWKAEFSSAPNFSFAKESSLGADMYELPKKEIYGIASQKNLYLTQEKKEFIKNLSDILETPVSFMGSALFNADIPTSDWDILVYGKDVYEKIKMNWQEILSSLKAKNLTSEVIENKAEIYSGRFSLNLERTKNLLNRRNAKMVLQNGREASLIFTPKPEEMEENYSHLPSNVIDIKTEDILFNDKQSILMPRKYFGEKYTVISYRWFDRDLARTGEKIKIKGKLLEEDNVIFLTSDDHYIFPS